MQALLEVSPKSTLQDSVYQLDFRAYGAGSAFGVFFQFDFQAKNGISYFC